MKIYKIIYLVTLCACSISWAQFEDEKHSSPKELKEDLQILKMNLEEVHPGLYAYHPKEELDSLFSKIEEELEGPVTSIEFYRKLLPLLPLIANNHTKIECPESYEKALAEELLRFPFQLYFRYGKLYVYEDLSEEQLIGPGREIKSINEKNTETIVHEMMNYASLDGHNVSFAERGIGIAFSRRFAYYFGTPKSFDIEFIDADGSIKTEAIKGLKASVLNQKRAKVAKSRNRTITFTAKDSIGYIKIPSFQPESSSKFRKTVKSIFQDIKTQNISNLIIDVRRNGGGYGEAANEVLSYLISETVYPYKDEYALVDKIPYPQYYEKDLFFNHFKKQPLVKKGNLYHIKNIEAQKIKPKSIAFSGKLHVLLDGTSASATGEFLGQIKSNTEAIFIGEEAGGNAVESTANDLLHMTLPNSGVRVTIPALRTIMNVNFKNTGHGVQPDFEIIPTIMDILQDNDVVLDFAYEKIKE